MYSFNNRVLVVYASTIQSCTMPVSSERYRKRTWCWLLTFALTYLSTSFSLILSLNLKGWLLMMVVWFRENPLALYVFSRSKKDIDLILNNTTAGGVAVNDTVMHAAVESLPFGGVGASGMGSYHGKQSFDCFVHHKSVLIKSMSKLGEKLSSSRYPPYSDSKMNFISMMLRKRRGISLKYLPHLLMFGLGIACTFGFSALAKAAGNNEDS